MKKGWSDEAAVLDRDQSLCVWAKQGENVSITLGAKHGKTIADNDGPRRQVPELPDWSRE